MKRKIIQLAGRTFVVSLPSKWAKAHGLIKGNELDVVEEGAHLRISTEAELGEKKAIIDVKKLGVFDKHYLTYLYHKGVDEVDIYYDDSDVLSDVQQSLSNLLGFEIVNQGSTFCTVKNVSKALESEFDSMLRRIFLVLLEMADGIFQAFKQKRYESLKNMRVLEETNNKLTSFCKRVINKRSYNEKAVYLYCIVRDLEIIADQYKYICDILQKEHSKMIFQKNTLEYFQQVNNYLENFYKLFYKFDREKTITFVKSKERMVLKGTELLEKSSGKEASLIHYLLSVVFEISELYGPYYNLNLS